MPQAPPRSAHPTRMGTAFWAAKLALLLLGLASAALIVRFAVPISFDLILSTLPRFSAAARTYLVPPYIFVVVNFMIFVILKLPDAMNHNRRKEALATGAAASRQKPPKDLPDSTPRVVSPNAWPVDAAVPFASGPDSLPEFSDSLPGDWSTGSSLTTDFDGGLAVTSPRAVTVVIRSAVEIGVRPSEQPSSHLVEEAAEDHNSMDATWRAITGGEVGGRELKKNETWSTPPRVRLEPAARRELRKSETFREPSSSPTPAASRQTLVVERRVIGREVSVGDDNDDINRKCEAFIKKGRDQMRLQREESAAQRYVEMVSNAGY